MEKWAKLPEVADSTLSNLSSDYLTINRVAGNSNALSISVYLAPEYDAKPITDLKRVADNIVELDLSGLPIGRQEMGLAGSCPNLEVLEIDRTPVTDTDVERLAGLVNLRLLKVYETSIGDKSVPVLGSLPELKSLYLWGTGISLEALGELRNARPDLSVDHGIDPETRAFFTITDTVQEKKGK